MKKIEENLEYKKDFTGWNEIKQTTDNKNTDQIFIREGAVWLIHLGVNIGSELDGKGDAFLRPVIIVRKINNQVFFGIPISSKLTGNYFRHPFVLLGKQRNAILSQIRPFDKKRCMRFMTMLDSETMELICKKISRIFLKNETPQPSKTAEENLKTR